MAIARLTGMAIYPVKSARAIALTTTAVGQRGLMGDRDWMLVDTRGRFASQRTLPQMAQLMVASTPNGLALTFDGHGSIEVDIPQFGEWCDVEVWGDPVRARDAGDIAARFLSAALKSELRLVWMPPESIRPVDPTYAGREDLPVSFADGFPILIANQASLDDLNQRLPSPIPMARFRPNLVIEGWPPFAEDDIRHIRCGEVELLLVKPCTRCSIPALDHLSGERALDPTPVLRSFRYDRTLKGVTFGVNALVLGQSDSRLALGDSVQVLD